MAKAKTAQKRTRKVKVVTEKEALKKAAAIAPEAVGEVVQWNEEIWPGLTKAALDALQTNVFIADPQFRLIYMNKKAEATLRLIEDEIQRAFDLSVDEILGGSIHRFHRDPKRVERILKNPDMLPYQAEFGFGNVILRTNIAAVYGEDNELLGYVVNWEEVSELKKRANEAARLRSFIEKTVTAIMQVDRQHKITFVNPAMVGLFKKHADVLKHELPQFDPEKLVGMSVEIFCTDSDQRCALQMEPANTPFSKVIKIGPLHFKLNVCAMYDANNEYIGNTLEWHEITDRLQLKDSAMSSAEELEETAGAFLEISNQMASNAEETSVQSNTVSAAAEQISRNVSGVASSIEEMNSSIKRLRSEQLKRPILWGRLWRYPIGPMKSLQI
ncbi:MAG: PAS domain-containing protein [candidate division KSB1 bacterium]|nr:PAS domain-containing protein [candidate division KSB1 bacterium]